MATVPPPNGMSEVDYEAIEAAVTETVRGRWFLNEFARRNRSAEIRQVLDAIGRIEGAVASGQAALPPADPSIRLLMQRIKEVAGQLDMLAGDMRATGVEERYAAAVEKEARAVSGMLRGPALPRPPAGQPATLPPSTPMPTPEPMATREPEPGVPMAAAELAVTPPPGDPRLAALAPLDALPVMEKLALFA